MHKFSMGEKVVITKLIGYSSNQAQGLVVGNTGTIVRRNENGSYAVRTDNAREPTDGISGGWGFYEEELEAVDNG